MCKLILCFIFGLILSGAQLLSQTLTEALKKVTIVAYPETGRAVDKIVAEEFKTHLAPHAKIFAARDGFSLPQKGVIRIAISDENFAEAPALIKGRKEGMLFRLRSSGDGEIVAAKSHLLYALFCLIKDDWINLPLTEFENGKLVHTSFPWLCGEDGFYATKKNFARHYDAEASIKELARLGCSHVVVNALATPFPLEINEPGEIYYRFYNSAPDLDQFVETKLNKGTYPPEYLAANLAFLKKQAQLAVKYGLNPGLFVCNPRTVPESLLERYPYLRGARVDHPFRSFRPRYTLSLGHPVVRWHYAEMLRKILTEIPQIAFVSTFLNDSGSGFEYTMRLYPGRNGGPYIVREWNPNEAFAEAASKNVVRYYHLLRDVGKEINPDFRLIAGLRAIPEEEDIILEGMCKGIDLAMSLADKNDPIKWQKEQQLTQRGSHLFTGTSAKACYLLGVPSPWLTYQKLSALIDNELDRITVEVDPPSLVPWDINREVVKAIQLNGNCQIEDVINKAAKKWATEKYAPQLVDIWQYANEAVVNFPDVPLYGTNWAFEMYRLWVRPYVPDIDKIPESEREYYQKFTMSIFNNPHNVDLAADCLWELISVEQGEQIVKQCDEHVWEPLNTAITLAQKAMDEIPKADPAISIFSDLRDRLLAVQCYFKTLRNTGAWIAGVHGYMRATNEAEKKKRLSMVRDMQDSELQNARDLLNLWQQTKVDFIPIQSLGESWYVYGENLGELIQKKIALMEKHKNDLPFIDPNYMWRMPAGSGFEDKEYLKY